MSNPSLASFSSSLFDSSSFTGSSILDSSSWNRKKAEQPIQGKPGIGRKWGASTTTTEEAVEHEHLLQKKLYPTAIGTTTTSSTPASFAKTELEAAVLKDCLSNNFLFSHLANAKLDDAGLLEAFEKVRYRKNEVITRQGDAPDYFYVLFAGDVRFSKDGQTIPKPDDKYTVFGELPLLTATPQDMTVKATSDPCTLFRLERGRFWRFLQPASMDLAPKERLSLLQDAIPTELVEYLKDDETSLKKLVAGMTTKPFRKGDVLYQKGTPIHAFCIVTKGEVVLQQVEMGGRSYEDLSIGPGHAQTSFGWLTLSEDEPLAGTVVARSDDGVCVIIDKHVFLNVLGGPTSKCGPTTLQHVCERRTALIELKQLAVFRDSRLDAVQLYGLLDRMHHVDYAEGEMVLKHGEKTEPALYFVRSGSVELYTTKNQQDNPRVIEAGGYFGEKNMLLDQNKDGKKHYCVRSITTVKATSPTRMDVLYLEECRQVVDTTLLGLGQSTTLQGMDRSIRLGDLTRHALLGAGSYGQVWLASAKNNSSSEEAQPPQIVALKVQAKHQLLESMDRAHRVIGERNILASLRSPFLLKLYNACQDDHNLYMITTLLQGGELESLLPHDGLPESAARFYAAGILEGLVHLHQRHVVHRDVKTQNVLLNGKGYPVLIDYGFAKYVADKTYTFCGSPMYTAPEIIRTLGHDKGCDYWSWGVLVFRMVTGRYPFYTKGMDQLGLYKQICKGSFTLEGSMSVDFRSLMTALLYPDPAQRLGSRGWRDIVAQPWLSRSMDWKLLRRQELPAPWIPNLQDPLDASRFHPDASEVEDLMTPRAQQGFPVLTEQQQEVFANFGPSSSLGNAAGLAG